VVSLTFFVHFSVCYALDRGGFAGLLERMFQTA